MLVEKIQYRIALVPLAAGRLICFQPYHQMCASDPDILIFVLGLECWRKPPTSPIFEALAPDWLPPSAAWDTAEPDRFQRRMAGKKRRPLDETGFRSMDSWKILSEFPFALPHTHYFFRRGSVRAPRSYRDRE